MATTAAIIVFTLAATDLVVGGAFLIVVAAEYRRLRRAAAVEGRPLPSAGRQFAFVGGAVAAGVIAAAVSVVWLVELVDR